MTGTSLRTVALSALLLSTLSSLGVAQGSLPGWSQAPAPNASRVDANGIQVSQFSGQHSWFQGQRIPLMLRLPGPDTLPPPGEPCPTIFLRTRAPAGESWYQAIGGKNDKRCRIAGDDSGARWIDFRLPTDQRMQEGEYSLEFLEFGKSSDDKNAPQFMATSLPFVFRLEDVRKRPYSWQSQVKGLSMEITLDKSMYKVGEEVPFHVALANLHATVPITMWQCVPVQFTLRNVQGDRVRYWEIGGDCAVTSSVDLGPGPTSSPVAIVAMERILSTEGMSPGYYTLTGSWLAYPGTYHRGEIVPDDPEHPSKPYAFVYSNAVSIQVVADDKHPWIMPVVSVTSLPAIFRQAETSFGPNTAMLDTSTGLKWLHLDLTQNWTIRNVLNNMGPGELFAGWRYATDSEVRAMFATFIGNSTGRSTNPTGERVLQSGLGGPLDLCAAYERGWCRESSEGYAKIDAEHYALVGYVARDIDPRGITITIDPEIQGGSTTAEEGFQQSGSGSYLVQDAGSH